MAVRTRVRRAGRVLLLCAALLVTYFLFAVGAIRVALKMREVVVPPLVGRSVNDASALLADTGLTLKVEEGRRIDPTIAASHIVSQDPSANVTTRRPRSVKVWLSAGSRATTIPALAGETDRAAQLHLKEQSIELGGLSEFRSAEYTADAVIAQEPPAGSQGTKVALLVNRGERSATYVMPDLIGVDGDRAADVLRARGFRLAVVSTQPYPGVPGGIVLRQYPQAGYQIAQGEPISLEVSR